MALSDVLDDEPDDVLDIEPGASSKSGKVRHQVQNMMGNPPPLSLQQSSHELYTSIFKQKKMDEEERAMRTSD